MTTDALRKQVVEAMAQALNRYDEEARMPWFRQEAAVALDAALGVLGEQLEALVRAADPQRLAETIDPVTGARSIVVAQVLAVLRAGKSRIDDPSGKGSDE